MDVFGIKHYHEVRALAATVHAFHPTILTSGCGLPRKGTTFQPIIFPNPISYSRLKYFRENSWTSNSWSLSQLLAYSMRYSAKVSCISPPSRKTFGHPLVSRKPGGHFANEDSESNTRELYLRYLMIHSHTVALHLIRYLWYFCIGRHKLIQKHPETEKKSLDHKILKAHESSRLVLKVFHEFFRPPNAGDAIFSMPAKHSATHTAPRFDEALQFCMPLSLHITGLLPLLLLAWKTGLQSRDCKPEWPGMTTLWWLRTPKNHPTFQNVLLPHSNLGTNCEMFPAINFQEK